jgi:putative drug exporter of the RND superfamily
MFDRLARLACRRPKLVLLVAGVLILAALTYGIGVFSGLKTGGDTVPTAESSRAEAAIEAAFPTARPNLILLVRGTSGQSADDPVVAAAGATLAAKLAAEPNVTGVVSYWGTRSSALRSTNGDMALIAARLTGDENATEQEFAKLAPDFDAVNGPVTVQLGGAAAVERAVSSTVRGDIAVAELIGVPITAVVMIILLQGLFAALLPLLVGIISVIGTFAALRLLSTFTDVSIFSLNLTTGLSLGLAADYGLFIVKRFREERSRLGDVELALRVTMNTAGRTIAFSSLTVAVSVSAMAVFPQYFLRSFAYAGVFVVILASLSAMVALPAALVVTGKWLDFGNLTEIFGNLFRRGKPRPEGQTGWWHRIAVLVMRRPVTFAGASILILVLLGVPVLGLNIALPDDRVLPAGAESHVVQQELRADFSSIISNEIDVYVPGAPSPTRQAQLADYASRVSDVPGVTSVDTLVGSFARGAHRPPSELSQRYLSPTGAYLAVDSGIEPYSSAGIALVQRIRAVYAPFETQVSGQAADLLDSRDVMLQRLPWALGIVVATTLILIFLLTGSVLIPIKALIMNTLNLSATFGVLVWIFQDYHLGGALAFQRTGWVDVTMLILLFCVAFGVSMDYEVFLLSRIKEEYARTRDNTSAVAYGIEKTGGIVTAAALITAIVFIAMVTARVSNIKMFGMGLALSLIMDATLIRTILVPALMRLAGNANWWSPRFLRWVYDRFGLKESSVLVDSWVIADGRVGNGEEPPVGADQVSMGGR